MDTDFEEFVRARSSSLMRTAFFLIGDRVEAEDLLQSALLRMSLRWHKARENPDAYVRQVLVNLARDRQRRFWRRPVEMLTDEVPTDRHPQADLSGRIAEQDLVIRALRSLPRRQREVIVLRYLEDLSLEETCGLLGCSQGTVKSQASKGLAKLREALGSGSIRPTSDRWTATMEGSCS